MLVTLGLSRLTEKIHDYLSYVNSALGLCMSREGKILRPRHWQQGDKPSNHLSQLGRLYPLSMVYARPAESLLRFLEREANAQKQGGLLDVVVLVTQYPNTARLHHQAERERKVVAQPSLSERSRRVAMCNQDDVLGFTIVHMRCLDLTDLFDQDVEARSQFFGRSSKMSIGKSHILGRKCFHTRHLHSRLSRCPIPVPGRDRVLYAAL